ncbi:MAG: ZIP family metal transporter [Nocardioidaceae bacterium]
MLEAGLYGLLGGSTLVVGAVVGCLLTLPRRFTGAVMALGAGVLIASVAYELVGESAHDGTLAETSIGLAAGALVFFAGDVIITRGGGSQRKRSRGMAANSAAAALALGALLDGIPESAAIGITSGGSAPSLAFLVAVALSNLPEGLSSSAGMRTSGHSIRSILALWTGIALASGVAAAVGAGLVGGASAAATAVVLSFAAGAILAMIASTMLPEASEEGGPVIGLATTAGFLAAVLLDQL